MRILLLILPLAGCVPARRCERVTVDGRPNKHGSVEVCRTVQCRDALLGKIVKCPESVP